MIRKQKTQPTTDIESRLVTGIPSETYFGDESTVMETVDENEQNPSHETNVNQKPTAEPPNNQKMIIQIPVITKMSAQSPAIHNIIFHTFLALHESSQSISANL